MSSALATAAGASKTAFRQRLGIPAAGAAANQLGAAGTTTTFSPVAFLRTTYAYYATLWYYLRPGRTNVGHRATLAECPYFQQNPHAQLHLFSIVLVFKLWSEPHYRCGSFGEDLRVNLRNLAFPGTGVPLSWFCFSKATAYVFVLCVYPWLCLGAAVVVWAVERRRDSMAVDDRSGAPPRGESVISSERRDRVVVGDAWSNYPSAAGDRDTAAVADKQHRQAGASPKYHVGAATTPGQKKCDPLSEQAKAPQARPANTTPSASWGATLGSLLVVFWREFLPDVLVMYQQFLVAPDTWFSWWRLNCALATYHSSLTKSADYSMENKWDFLKKCYKQKIPITPCVGLGLVDQIEDPDAAGAASGTSGRDPTSDHTLIADYSNRDFLLSNLKIDTLVCKDKNEEGGMGICFFKNAACGGDWILQEKLENAKCLGHLLPDPCPLSTFRVLTASEGSMRTRADHDVSLSSSSSPGQSPSKGEEKRQVHVLTCVFRAGRQHAKTDHRSIFYNVDLKTGRITRGGSNGHWYQLGVRTMFQSETTGAAKDGCYSSPSGVFHTGFFEKQSEMGSHPDTGKDLVGEQIPCFADVVAICERAHAELCPEVPLVGWDVALVDVDTGAVDRTAAVRSPQGGTKTKGDQSGAKPVLLEANLSCNFFLGDFPRGLYFDYMRRNFLELERLESERAGMDKKRA